MDKKLTIKNKITKGKNNKDFKKIYCLVNKKFLNEAMEIASNELKRTASVTSTVELAIKNYGDLHKNDIVVKFPQIDNLTERINKLISTVTERNNALISTVNKLLENIQE